MEKKFDYREYIKNNKFTLGKPIAKKQLVTEIKLNLLPEVEDDGFTHIGYGNYKKTSEKDKEGAQTYKKDDKGKYIPTGGDDAGSAGGGQAKPKVNIFDKPKAAPKAAPKFDGSTMSDEDKWDLAQGNMNPWMGRTPETPEQIAARREKTDKMHKDMADEKEYMYQSNPHLHMRNQGEYDPNQEDDDRKAREWNQKRKEFLSRKHAELGTEKFAKYVADIEAAKQREKQISYNQARADREAREKKANSFGNRVKRFFSKDN